MGRTVSNKHDRKERTRHRRKIEGLIVRTNENKKRRHGLTRHEIAAAFARQEG